MATKAIRPEYPDYHTKRQASLRLSEEGHELLDACKDQLGIGRADVVEMAVRLLSKKLGVSA